MGYFKTSLDDDISYLLDEIGYSIKINNVKAKAIVNNTTIERTIFSNDNKTIITKTKIGRGDYVECIDLYFLVTSEVNQKRYNLYYKGTMRRCNHDIKIVLDNKLYLFYTIIDSNKFGIDEGKYISTFTNTITITIPLTDVTEKIKEGNKIVKFGKVWEITGMDYTQDGLIHLQCKTCTIDTNTDNMEEEIADFDKLPEDYTLIYPFDIEDDNGDNGDNGEPEPEDPPEPEEPEFYIIITGADKMDMTQDETYTAKVYDLADEYIYKSIVFSVDDTTLANIKSQSNNQCELVANMNYNIGNVTLRGTLVENENIFGEKVIGINQI